MVHLLIDVGGGRRRVEDDEPRHMKHSSTTSIRAAINIGVTKFIHQPQLIHHYNNQLKWHNQTIRTMLGLCNPTAMCPS